MYNNYTPLQQRQLALQEYSNTQSTYLLVCASARSTALKATLTDQLHRKFRLVDRLGGELTASVDGVLLAAEDVELMSTALMYFAKALQDGADYAVCNAVFGFGGATALYQSQPLQAQNRCAVISRTLLERCRAAAHDPENVPELLALAAQLCTKPTLIPQALLHYERGICAEDAFSAHGKRAFIMSHVLDMTGAPIVLVSAVPVLRSMGYEVLVLGPSDGGSLHLFLDAGASVITRSSCRNVSDAWGMALCADFVIANTVVMARAVRALSGTAVPVLWWLHDAFAGYPFISHSIPKALGKNVHLCAVGSHATAAMHSVRPDFEIEQLIYGLPDQTLEQWENTLADALVLAPRHISCYGLKLEEGTPLYDRRESLNLPDGDLQADMYLYAVELLGQNGYVQYEISNFAQPGYESRHNLKYWMLEEYAGFGPGAYSDFGGVRYGYTRDLDGYIAGRLDLAESERISPQEREMEYIMLRLRTARGIDIREFENRFRQRFAPLAAILESCAAHGLARQTETGWCLTPRGFLVSNRIIGDLQEELNREKVQRLARAAQGDYRVVE